MSQEVRPQLLDGIHWRAAAWSGIVAGVVFLALEMILWPLTGLGSPWEPVRMIAAILIGPSVLPPPASFNGPIFLAALFVHFSLSVFYAVSYAVFCALVLRARLERLTALAQGLFGLIIYVVNFYGFVELFPWFVEARNGISILVHIAWGIVLPWAYDVRFGAIEKGKGQS
ncbi:MAG: hypothetical protein GEU90_21875 [Gemmatimonas sp.]|nr:hypothetical protein [Gemmatimonas sp.]